MKFYADYLWMCEITTVTNVYNLLQVDPGTLRIIERYPLEGLNTFWGLSFFKDQLYIIEELPEGSNLVSFNISDSAITSVEGISVQIPGFPPLMLVSTIIMGIGGLFLHTREEIGVHKL